MNNLQQSLDMLDLYGKHSMAAIRTCKAAREELDYLLNVVKNIKNKPTNKHLNKTQLVLDYFGRFGVGDAKDVTEYANVTTASKYINIFVHRGLLKKGERVVMKDGKKYPYTVYYLAHHKDKIDFQKCVLKDNTSLNTL